MQNPQPKLFALYLGGSAVGAKIEVHDVIFVVSDSLENCYPKIVAKWFGDKQKVHIDAYMILDSIEGFDIQLETKKPIDQDLNLYFVNIGGYLPNSFFEMHNFGFVVAKDPVEAKSLAKQKYSKDLTTPHKDNLEIVDNLIQINQTDGFFVSLKPNSKAKNPQIHPKFINFLKQ
ncbi:MAG: DUF1543 domain-containing protein [Flammeovirgaceae bacterium]